MNKNQCQCGRAITDRDTAQQGRGGSVQLVSVDKRRSASGCFHTQDQIDSMINDPEYAWQCPVVKVGKKSAGRLLDGREWSEVPQ